MEQFFMYMVTGFVLFGALLIVSILIKLAIEIVKEKNPSACKWKGEGEYETACGNRFFDSTESGNPITDWAKYCPYCGRVIRT